MADYTPAEVVDMIRIVGAANDNYSAAARLYAERYPDRRHPSRITIKSLIVRAEGGNLRRIRRKTGPDQLKSVVTLAVVTMNPHTSTRKIEQQHGICRATANRIFRFHKFHPYHIHLTQTLEQGDFNRRLQFCNWAINQSRNDRSFFSNMLFSDEANFNNEGGVNRHNCHYYSNVNPHWQRNVHPQRKWSINVWAGIIGNHVIGPYLFQGSLTGIRYLNFLQNDLPVLLEDLNLNIRARMWFQQDGAPAHTFGRAVNHLNNVFRNRWIGLRGPIHEWPPRSPDLTPLDFFLWGFIKEKVYATEPTTIEDMQERIREAFRSITPQILRNVQNDFRRRVRVCIQQNGGLFEHLR